jgi:hypothetical protein
MLRIAELYVYFPYVFVKRKTKVKLSPYQAVEAYRVVRC